MPIATKNNAIIVKDGKLAENCGCCGGWYCCFSPACAADSLSSVMVTITAQNYLVWQKAQFRGGLNDYVSIGFYGAAYNGTHSLLRQPNSTTWSKVFAPSPHSTCVGSLSLLVGNDSWALTFLYSAQSYGDFVTETYKELTEMECRGLPDRNAGYPQSSGPQGSQSINGFVGQCSELLNITQSKTFQAVFPLPLFSNSNGSRVNVREEGDYTVTMSLSVS